MKLLRPVHHWRLRRAYRVIARCEAALVRAQDFDAASALREVFLVDTLGRLDQWQRRSGWTRQQRRDFRRQVAAAR